MGRRPDVEVEGDAERELRARSRSVREADVGQPGGAEQDRVRRLAHLEGLARQILAGPPVAGGARLHPLEGEPSRPGTATAWSTLSASAITSGPMPSPPTTAIR